MTREQLEATIADAVQEFDARLAAAVRQLTTMELAREDCDVDRLDDHLARMAADAATGKAAMVAAIRALGGVPPVVHIADGEPVLTLASGESVGVGLLGLIGQLLADGYRIEVGSDDVVCVSPPAHEDTLWVLSCSPSQTRSAVQLWLDLVE